MGFELPPALAGDDNEVELDQDGLIKVLRLTGGVAIAGGIVAAGLYVKDRLARTAGADQESNMSFRVA